MPRRLTKDSGHFWFFHPDNVELVVKALDGCALNGRTWIFAAGLTDLEVAIRVKDRRSGLSREYWKPAGEPLD